MNFLLSLISFLLIVFGLVFGIAAANDDVRNRTITLFEEDKEIKLSDKQVKKIHKLLDLVQFTCVTSIILGIGIIVARIFS